MMDARGISCPQPVIMLKKAMESKANNYEILVDCKTSLENISRFAKENGYSVDYSLNDGDYTIKLSK